MPYQAEPVKAPCNGSHPGHHQTIHAGSHGVVDPAPDFMGAKGFMLQTLVMATTPGTGKQGLMGTWSETDQTGASLILAEDGSLGFIAGDGNKSAMVSTGVPLSRREWCRVAAVCDAGRRQVTLHQHPLVGGKPFTVTAPFAQAPTPSKGKFLVAARHRDHKYGRGYHYHTGCFIGRLGAPRVVFRPLDDAEIAKSADDLPDGTTAHWDFDRPKFSLVVLV